MSILTWKIWQFVQISSFLPPLNPCDETINYSKIIHATSRIRIRHMLIANEANGMRKEQLSTFIFTSFLYRLYANMHWLLYLYLVF